VSLRNPFRRLPGVPEDAVSSAALAPGERVLAATSATDGTWLLGTRDALHIVPGPGGDSARGVTRIPWENVEHADWDRDDERLVVFEVGEFGRVKPRHELGVSEPGLLLELVRERVTASVVLQRRVLTQGKKGLVVIGRRAPSGEGEVAWAFRFDPGVDPDDPAVAAAAEAGLRAAEADLGI
jgi:hypothetical protein